MCYSFDLFFLLGVNVAFCVSFGNYWSSCLAVRVMIVLSCLITVIDISGRLVTWDPANLFVSNIFVSSYRMICRLVRIFGGAGGR